MCGIIAGYEVDILQELFELNSKRGTQSHSTTIFHGDMFKTMNFEGTYLDIYKLPEFGYKIIHLRSSTTSNKSRHHPTRINNSLLWHNGMLKTKCIEENGGGWDTEIILRELLATEFTSDTSLSKLDGTFACLSYYNGELYCFRNEISPLFYDNELNFSSILYKEMIPVPSNEIFKIDFKSKTIQSTGNTFTTKENPYFLL